MKTDDRFTKAFQSYFARNKGPEGQSADYEISATGDESTGIIELTLVFKKGVRYCCYEWGCHIGIQHPGGWDALRQCLSESGLQIEAKITLHLKVVVEQGAIVICEPSQVSQGCIYEETIQEGKNNGGHIPDRPPGFTGTWTTYWENGQKCSEKSYVDGQLHEKSIEWNDRGQKLRECSYKNGQRHGSLTQWNTNGDVKDISEWDNGTGTYRIFYASGILSSEQQLHHGIIHGVKREWDGTGKLICTEHYEKGKLVRREGKPRWRHLCANQD